MCSGVLLLTLRSSIPDTTPRLTARQHTSLNCVTSYPRVVGLDRKSDRKGQVPDCVPNVATVEDIDFRVPRGLDRSVILALAQGPWVREHHNVLITGPTGCGKSFLACALANAAIRQGHTALYVRAPRLLDDLALGRADGRYARTLAGLARVGVLVLDDFLLSPAPVEACRDLLEVIEDRTGLRATVVASQLPVDKWHPSMADPTLADAVLDRVCQAAHRIALRGASMRKRQPASTTDEVGHP
jgi:DNA replication protein DnaC